MGDSDHITFTAGEFYQIHFDSREYLNSYYRSPQTCYDFFPFVLRHLNETDGNIKGNKLIEIGKIEDWLNKEEGCFDWSPTIQFVCELEGRSRSPEEVEQRLRQIVKQVLRCDVRQENPFHPLTMEPADRILSSFCLDSACEDLETYRRALQSIAALLKPGGALVLFGVFNASFYFVGHQRVFCLVLSQSLLEALRDLGFSIKQVNILPGKESQKVLFDAEEMYHLVAQKTK
ncbi:hypothetical protein SKAU_G00085820 [Synaphobranchus kaupii]|uniref:Uncharacterized protein n=1 Tax=Synaphobranchus kaupii TaxID=118154 RepID=A0A9Q1J5M9_SYNKA|nr:hypothetical protein SKAU_G00085820 [Synaphobranchus kaupii]